MNPLLLVLVLALIGLLGARLTFARRRVPLGPQIFIVVGGPFLFLGFLLGPYVLHVLSEERVDQLIPLLALGLGWIGILFGLQLDYMQLRRFPLRYLAVAWIQAVVAFALVFLIGYLITGAWFGRRMEAIILAAAATACVSTPAAIALVSNTYMSRGPMTRLLFYVASLDGAVGIVALGLTHAAHHTGFLGEGIAMSTAEWLVISLLLGVFFGVLFLSLTRVRPRSQELALLLIGLVLFAAGTAFYLSVSPLFVCMIAGIVIGNLSPMRRRVYKALSAWEQPIYILVLVLAGALLKFPSWWIVPLVAVYASGRLLAKWLGGIAAARIPLRGFSPPDTFGLALVPQGGISLAMAISFVLIYVPGASGIETAANILFATVVIAVGLSDLIGPFMIRAVLERAGELHRRPVPAGTVG